MTLTDRQIRFAQVPSGLNQVELRDDVIQGLVLRVYRSGARTWMLQYRRQEDNRRRLMKLGAYPGVTLKQARKLARLEVGRVAGGEDPLQEKRERLAGNDAETMADLAEDFLERYSKPFKRPAGFRMDCWQLDTYVLPRWGQRPIDEITRFDIKELLDDLADGTIAAGGNPTKTAPRNLRALLSKMFDWATDQGRLPANPAAGVKLPDRVRIHLRRGGKERVLSEGEIGILWEELDQMAEADREKNRSRVSIAAFRLILLTAQRPGEVFSMRWCDIEDGVWWVVPAEIAKNGTANRVFLSPQARSIVEELRPYNGDSGWVLQSPRKPGQHLTTIKTANQGILERTDMKPWSPHDLRRTAATKMSQMGVRRRVIMGILNHKDRSITSIYDRYGLDPEKQEALTRWGRRVEELTGGGAGARVVEFRRRAR